MKKIVFLSALLLFLFANPVFAQDIVSQVASILTPFVGVIFILIFILILLAVGGVLPKREGKLPIGLISFTILIALLFVIPQFVPFPQYLEVPESFKYQSLPEAAKDALQLIGLPREWGYVPAIIYLFILPFAAIYTLVWSFLVSIKIFEEARVNRILALIATFMTIPVGWFTKIVWVLFSFMGIWSVVIFAATFILGIFFKGAGLVSKEHLAFQKLAYIKKERINEAIKELRVLENADLETIKDQVPSILKRFTDVFPVKVQSSLTEAASSASADDAHKHIKDAIKELEKQLKS